jgi:large subunit ribosomal protein L21
MYAIVETGGKQYRVKPGDTIAVERLAGEPGETLDLGRVLLVGGDGAETRIGAPAVEGAVVRAEVVEHGRGEKIIVFRYKSKVRYRRKTGHRQALTRLRITDIMLDGASAASAISATGTAPAAAEPAAPAPRRRRAAAEPAAEVTAVGTESATAQAESAETETEAAETDMPAAAGEGGPPLEGVADDAEPSEATKE